MDTTQPLPLRSPPLPSPPPLNPPISPSTPTPTSQLFHPYPLPTTTSTTTHHRKKRSKFLRINIPNNSIASSSSSTLKTATKKPDPSAPKITRPCTECGKTFWSWKALFGHMRCHPERQWRGINPPPHLRRAQPLRYTPPPSPHSLATTADDHEVAAGLLMLASAPGPGPDIDSGSARFECSSCKKTFGSHQALGGHRASHKNVKGCFAITKNSTDSDNMLFSIVEGQNQNEVVGDLDMGLGLGLGLGLGHRCGICLRVFSSGQALGGHMRCHWDHPQAICRPREAQSGLDLNFPAPLLEDGSCSLNSSNNASNNNDKNSIQLDLRLGI